MRSDCQGRTALESGSFDLLILGVHLPDGSGLDRPTIVEQLREAE